MSTNNSKSFNYEEFKQQAIARIKQGKGISGKEIYKERHKIENLFGFIKHYRRLFARFDKLKKNFLGFLHFVGTLIWLR
jgi:transposase